MIEVYLLGILAAFANIAHFATVMAGMARWSVAGLSACDAAGLPENLKGGCTNHIEV